MREVNLTTSQAYILRECVLCEELAVSVIV
jgi:hypothetical protein